METKSFTQSEVQTHNKPDDAWIIVEGYVYNVTKFARLHPGGKKILLDYAGRDASKEFNSFHTRKVLDKYHKKLCIGDVQGYHDKTVRKPKVSSNKNLYGELVPYADPSWYQGWNSPYFGQSHRDYRACVRGVMEAEIAPHVDKWLDNEEIPISVGKRMAEFGIYQSAIKGVWYPQYFGTKVPGDVKMDEFNWHHTMILVQEIVRVAGVAFFWGVFAGIGIGLAPIINFGSEYLKDKVVADCANARKYISLAVTEPWAGSDVGNLQTVARKSDCGKFYIVSGIKKWITAGLWSDYFTTAVRTGGPGMKGISMLLIERDSPGVSVKKMKCQGMWGSGTSYITFEDVKVPIEHLIGKEGKGFKYIMANFNTERFGIVCQSLGCARVCYEEAFKFAHKRKTFGKKLIEHGVIRNKLGHMVRQIESVQHWCEQIAHQLNTLTTMEQMLLGGTVGLAKAHAGIVFEYCAREAIQIFGGAGYTRTGQGQKVERMYRDVRGVTIPGGSEEILLDLGMRQAQAFIPRSSKI